MLNEGSASIGSTVIAGRKRGRGEEGGGRGRKGEEGGGRGMRREEGGLRGRKGEEGEEGGGRGRKGRKEEEEGTYFVATPLHSAPVFTKEDILGPTLYIGHMKVT